MMASSYVEVKESGDSGNDLPFEIATCESNGVDLQAHLDGEPPRDHTYNKDPDVISESPNYLILTQNLMPIHVREKREEVIAGSGEEEKDSTEDFVVKANKSTKSSKKVKQQKTKKSQNENSKSPKSAVKKSPRKKVQEVSDAPDENIVDHENDSSVVVETEDAENISPKLIPHKNSRKRKNENESSEVDTKQIKILECESTVDYDEDEGAETENNEEKTRKKTQKKQKSLKTKNVKTKSPPKVIKGKKIQEKGTVKSSTTLTQKTTSEKKKAGKLKDVGSADAGLPPGWTKKVVERKSGKTAGTLDIYIYSPEGIKFRSKPDIAAYLARTKSSLKLEDFSFTRKRVNADIPAKPSTSPDKKVSPPQKTVGKKKPTTTKKSGKIVVKLSTPRKSILSDKQNNDAKKEGEKKNKLPPKKPMGESKATTSGINSSKRTSRKK